MGLDQYLYADKWYMDDEKHFMDDEIIGKVKQVRWEVIYWRKANQIHRWFVDNVQGGEDDCKDYYVSIDQLKQLKHDVEQVLKDHSKAEILLPAQNGFFFGSTEYDKYYFEDLQYTKERLQVLFDNPEKFDRISFTYSSSW